MQPVVRAVSLACAVITGCTSAPPRDAEIKPIANIACKSDVVLLGELPSHGEAGAFGIKARIVQDLVQHCGFDAVLFEAPIYDFVGFQEAVQHGTAQQAQLDNAIGRFWLTRELASFRQWLFEQATSAHLMVGGLDDQLSATGQYARATLPALVPPECRDQVTRHVNWTYNDTQPFDAAEKSRLQSCVRSAALSGDKLLANLATYVARQVEPAAARTRDDVMYDNLRWHLSRLPAGSKVIVWTATVHAARTQGEISYKPLGASLVASGHRVTSIGFTALTGESSMAGRPARKLADLPATSLEARSTPGDVAWRLLDRDALTRLGNVPSRLLGKITSANWQDYFDAVIVIRNEVAPVAL